MGSDLTVVNAARISFHKEKTAFQVEGEKGNDLKLVNFLAKNGHWTPFGHCQVQFHIKLPIYIARQFMRSNVGIVYNEVSRRYVQDEPEFYVPDLLRSRPVGNAKQGSGPVVADVLIQETGLRGLKAVNEHAADQYRQMIAAGVAPEMARGCLPVSMYTEFYATMSLQAAHRVYGLRIDEHAQWEVQQYGKAMGVFCEALFEHSWRALCDA